MTTNFISAKFQKNSVSKLCHIEGTKLNYYLLFTTSTIYIFHNTNYLQGLTNQKNFHLPTGQVKKQITCPVEKLACPDSFFQK